MTPNEIKTIAEIVEIGFKVVAIVLGGVWAVFGLIAFQQRQAAVTALRKSEAEAASLELTSKRRAVLDITVNCEARRDLDTTGYVLLIQVVITNAGVAPAYLKFEEEHAGIRVQRVALEDAGTMAFPDAPTYLSIRNASDPSKAARSRVIRAGGVSRLSTVMRVRSAGVYAVSFRVPMDENNRQAMIEAGANPANKHYWSATSFACVGFAVEQPDRQVAAQPTLPAVAPVADPMPIAPPAVQTM